MPALKTSTSLLYGVFVSEKSFLIGVRRLVKREHTQMLVLKIAGQALPTELVNEIAERLYALEKAGILAKWDAMKTPEENYNKFSYAEARTEAEVRAFAKMVCTSSGHTAYIARS
jgi:hypothetical protein